MKQKETEYAKKIANYSPSTLRLLIRTNNTKWQRREKHRIVMEAKTEQEVIEKLEKLTMSGDLLEYYDKILERLENIEGVTIEMTFRLMNIEDKETLIMLAKMTDKELIDYLSNKQNIK